MGVSTDAQIWYGIVFEDGFAFPWQVGKYEKSGDINEWWLDVAGFIPIPVVEVNVCSDSSPIRGLAIQSSVRTASRGCPITFDLYRLNLHSYGNGMLLLDFCHDHGIDVNGRQPEWHLSSYWSC